MEHKICATSSPRPANAGDHFFLNLRDEKIMGKDSYVYILASIAMARCMWA